MNKKKKQLKYDLQTHYLVFAIFAIGIIAVDLLNDQMIQWAWVPIMGWFIAIVAHSVFYLRTK